MVQAMQQMQQQMTQLLSQVTALMNANQDLVTRVAAAEQTIATQRAGQVTSSGDGFIKGGLYDKRLYEPERLETKESFKEWSEDFFDFVEMCDAEIAQMLKFAKSETNVITATGATPDLQKKAKSLYRMLKQKIYLKEAKRVVVLARGKNPYEAWRLLHAKYDPNNDVSAGSVVKTVLNVSKWKCKSIAEVPTTIAAWEKLQDDYEELHADKAINEITKREILKEILPDDVRQFLEVQTMLRDTLSYDQIKSTVNNLAQKVAKVAVPMELSPLGLSGDQPLDSFGRQPVGGQKPGKGEGKGSASAAAARNSGKGVGDRDMSKVDCYNCGKTGHLARDCRSKAKVKGKGKGAKAVCRRDRGPDGKWNRRAGINPLGVE